MTLDDIALTLHTGLGAITIARLVEHFGSAEEVYAAGENALVEAGLKRPIAHSVALRETHARAEAEYLYMQQRGIKAVAVGDALYPRLLAEAADRPHVLYYIGNIEVLAGHTLAVVGTRNSTSYGSIMTDKMVEYLAGRVAGLCIVSGLAFGTDSNAHRAALRYGLPTAAVIPSSLPDIVPSEHTALAKDIIERGGVIVSEFHSGNRTARNSFVSRNRIIAAVSEGTLLVESKASGGSMTTAEFATGYNRTLLALMGRATDPTSAGTNRLIVNRTASAVCSGEDIVREMYWDIADVEVGTLNFDAPEPSREEKGLLSKMPAGEAISMDELCEVCGVSRGELSIMLVELEMDGAVRRLPGDSYIKL